MRTNPKNLLERINRRGRNEEGKITLAYLEKLYNLHEEWIQELRDMHHNILIIDADATLTEERCEAIYDAIKEADQRMF